MSRSSDAEREREGERRQQDQERREERRWLMKLDAIRAEVTLLQETVQNAHSYLDKVQATIAYWLKTWTAAWHAWKKGWESWDMGEGEVLETVQPWTEP